MGAHSRGEVASRIAVQAVARTLLPLLASEKAIPPAAYHHELRTAVGNANQAILAEARRRPECEGMGKTLILAVADGRSFHVTKSGALRVLVGRGRGMLQ